MQNFEERTAIYVRFMLANICKSIFEKSSHKHLHSKVFD